MTPGLLRVLISEVKYPVTSDLLRFSTMSNTEEVPNKCLLNKNYIDDSHQAPLTLKSERSSRPRCDYVNTWLRESCLNIINLCFLIIIIITHTFYQKDLAYFLCGRYLEKTIPHRAVISKNYCKGLNKVCKAFNTVLGTY